MRIDFSQLDTRNRPILLLKNLDGTVLQTLGYAFNVEVDLSFNEVSTLSFTLPATVDGSPTPHYDEAVGMRIVELVSVGQFYLLDPTEESDGPRKVKTCKAYSLEYEFTKKNIYLEEGTYNFFDGLNPDNPDTIVGRIREIMPDWNIVVTSGSLSDLVGRYRTFDDINKKVYEFIKSDVQEKYGCIFDFDTMTRTVYVTSVTATNNDVKKVYLSQDNLIKKITVNEDSDGIVTCLDVYGDDDVDIRGVNPTGENKIYNLDYFMTTDNFSQILINKWHAWEDAVEAQRNTYYDLQMRYNMLLLQILMAENGLSDTNQTLSTLQNEQAGIIQGIGTGTNTQSNLTSKNAQIKTAKNQAARANDSIGSMKAYAASLLADMQAINASLAMDAQDANDDYIYFEPNELAVLRRYFIEDTLQDDSFVASSVENYTDSGILSSSLSDVNITFSGVSNADGTLESSSIRGGTITVGNVLSGDVIYAYCRTNRGMIGPGQYTYSVTLAVNFSKCTVGGTTIDGGNLTITGVCSPSPSFSSGITGLTGSLYLTREVTEVERHQVEWDLMAYAKSVLAEKASPTYHFSVECANFLNLDEFAAFKNQLEFGKKIYLDLGGKIYNPYVISVHLSYEDRTSCQISFSDSYTSFDQSFSLAKLLEQSVSMGKSLSYKSGQYAAFVNSGASSRVKEFMESSLDIAKNAILSSDSQAITIDDTGIRIRKYKKNGSGNYILDANNAKQYEPEEMWMTEGSILFTDDSWATAKMAIGKVYRGGLTAYKKTTDTSQVTNKTYYINQYGTEWDSGAHGAWSTDLYEVDSTGTSGYGYGVVADYLVGTMIVGQNLIIECPGSDGQTILFKVDGSGASITNGTFTVTNGQSKIVLSPNGGIGIGTASMAYTLDSNTNTMKWNSSTNFWVDTNGNVHLKGTLEGATGTFSGSLSAATGTFAGELSAATGTFSGSLSAASGTFSGVVNAAGLYVNGQNVLTNTSAGSGTNAGYQVAGASSRISADYLDLGNITLDGTTGTVTIGQPPAQGQSGTGSGTLKMYGNIQMLGNITWGASNSPVQVQYSADGYSWHTTFNSTDTYAKYSYDGGNTWTQAIKIQGTDGQNGTNGTNGSDASVTLQNIRAALANAPDGIYTDAWTGGQICIKAGYITTGNLDVSGSVQVGAYYGQLKEYSGQTWIEGQNYQTKGLQIYAGGDVAASDYGAHMQFGSAQIWVASGVCSSSVQMGVGSDRRTKHDISYKLDSYDKFFNELSPVSYKYNNGSSDRLHIGFVAQDVEAALTQSGLTTKDFAGIVINDYGKDVDEDDYKGKDFYPHQYSLRYGEFIALNTHMIQKLYKRVEALEARLAAQE